MDCKDIQKLEELYAFATGKSSKIEKSDSKCLRYKCNVKCPCFIFKDGQNQAF